MAAHRRISQGPPPNVRDLPPLCAYFVSTNIILECILASQDVAQEDQQAILSYADHVLLRLTGASRLSDEEEESLAKSDQYWLFFFVRHLSDFVNIVTEEPGLPVYTLFPQDRILALRQMVVAIQGVIRRSGQSEDSFRVRNRAGNMETFEDKLDRLKAIGSGSRPTDTPQ